MRASRTGFVHVTRKPPNGRDARPCRPAWDAGAARCAGDRGRTCARFRLPLRVGRVHGGGLCSRPSCGSDQATGDRKCRAACAAGRILARHSNCSRAAPGVWESRGVGPYRTGSLKDSRAGPMGRPNRPPRNTHESRPKSRLGSDSHNVARQQTLSDQVSVGPVT